MVMNMKRNAHIIITILFLLAAPATLLGWGFALPAQYGDTFPAALADKCRRLEEAPGQRLVVVGGSAVAFGVDSALLEEQLPTYTPVNFGLYAALGTPVMLELSQPRLGEGDVVILCPEQQAQSLSDYVGGETLWQALDGHFDLLRDLSARDWKALAPSFPDFAARKLGYMLDKKPPKGEGVYTHASFDGYGDVVSPLCRANTMPVGWDSNTPISFAAGLATQEWVTLVNDYVDALAEQGVTVWYHFPPMNAAAVEPGSNPDAYFDWLQGQLHCPVIGDPAECVLDAGWFFDTNFHPNTAGKQVFTRILIRDCKAMLGDSSPTEIALPVMPALENMAQGREPGDGDCFTGEIREGIAVLTGLTQEGQTRRILTVPAIWHDCPVETLRAGVLKSETLEQVVLPMGIARIGDGAFAECPNLREIVLEQKAPSQVSVGQGLLEGTAATVYVPREGLSDYLVSYQWSVYSDRIQAKS